MCDIKQIATKINGPDVDEDICLTCVKTGKDITVSNKYGMFCEDLCDLKECKIEMADIIDVIKEFAKLNDIKI